MDFSGKPIAITGTGAGIGKRTVVQMASRGGMLTIGDIDLPKAEQVVKEIEEAGGRPSP